MPRPFRPSLPFFVLLLILFLPLSAQRFRTIEKGDLSVYFLGEMVGYEEYSWRESETGFLLEVKGRMTKPVVVELDRLEIELDKSFIPLRYYFRGTLGGVKQEVSSVLNEGSAVNTFQVRGKEQIIRHSVRRDSFLLPNPFYAPYIILAKKFRCAVEGKLELSAYIIPQIEIPLTLEASEQDPCLLLLQISGSQIELKTNPTGQMSVLQIPAQNLKVTNTISSPL